MLKKIFLGLALVALLVTYGLGFIPVDYKFGEDKQSGLASLLVESNMSNFSVCFLDLYTMEETTDMTIAKVKTTKAIQFNPHTLKITIKFTVVDDEGNEVTEAQSILDTLNIADYEIEGYYKVINRKIYVSDTPETVALTEDGYMFELDTFYQVRDKGATETAYVSGIAVGFTVIFIGTIVACLVMFAIKKPEED